MASNSAPELDTEYVERNRDSNIPAAEASGALRGLVGELAYRLPGCSDLEMRKALSNAARVFCDRTNCWTESAQMGVPTAYGGVPVTNVPDGAVVLRIRENRSWLVAKNGLGWAGYPGPNPCFFPGEYRPNPPFLCGRAPAPEMALAPAVGSETVPDRIVKRWGHAFVLGAFAELAGMEGKPWSQPREAAQAGQNFNDECASARAEFENGRVPPHLQTRSKIPFVV